MNRIRAAILDLDEAAVADAEQEGSSSSLDRSVVLTSPSTATLLNRLRDSGLPIALVTASRDSVAVLLGSGADDLFDAVVDGNDTARLGLQTKPEPDAFTEAARRLAVPPGACLVVENTVGGVHAARRGGFGVVIGVDRTGNRTRLEAAGANLVVSDLASLDLEAVLQPGAESEAGPPSWRAGASVGGAPWLLTYDGFDPVQEGIRESLCTLANGYLGTRGAAPECSADAVHYPGTYLAGVYNRLQTSIRGQTVEDEHLVNAPNWLPLRFAPAEGQWITPDSPGMLEYRQELDLRRGLLSRRMRVRNRNGNTLRVDTQCLVSRAAPHLAALRTTFTSENWSGTLRIQSSIDGGVVNAGVAAYAPLSNRHLQIIDREQISEDTVCLEAATTQSRVGIAMAARTRVYVDGDPVTVGRRLIDGDPDQIGHEFELRLDPGVAVTVEKVVAVATSRDPAVSTPSLAVAAWVSRAGRYADLVADHERAWTDLWRSFRVNVETGERAGTAVTLHTFHVLQSLAGAAEVDAGLPARGLHGEGYRGHVFWDELFVYPMVTLRRPALTRAVLLYRYRRLGEARAAARAAGLAGALFPWQSGSDGRDETPAVLFDPRSKSWLPDNSRLQRHVGLAVVYSMLQYVEASDDWPFLAESGIELMVEVIRCFVSMATYDPAGDRYDIDSVMGPDEFHDGYPGRAGSGVRNNAYTNILLAWILRRTIALVHQLDRDDDGRPTRRLGITSDELARWDQLSRRLRVPFHDDGVLSQFEGYEKLAEFDWDGYRARYGDIGRLDLILAAEGDSPNNYRVAKQPDVLMLLYLLSAEDLRETLEQLGYAFDKGAVRRTVDFYLARTSHGSTLSRPVCSWLLARADRTRSWSLFTEALDSDLADIQRGTTREGIHLGAMAGTVDLLLRCYTGLETRDGVLWLHPALPPELGRLRFRLSYRRHNIALTLTPTVLVLQLQARSVPPIQARVDDRPATLHAGHTYRFDLVASSDTHDGEPGRDHGGP